MRPVYFFMILGLLLSCKNAEKKEENQENYKVPLKPEISLSETYSSKEFGFSISYPKKFRLLESQLPGDSPVINIFDPKDGSNPPFAIHEEPELTFIAILPEGFGVDGPSGRREDLQNWQPQGSITIPIDKAESTVYLLENGEAWAYYLKLRNMPAAWEEYGGIFIHFPVSDFKAECFDAEGKQKEMRNCDPMGKDRTSFSGEIDGSARKKLLQVLNSFEFQASQEENISDWIRLEEPLPNEDISSPLEIKGKAKGNWFFEGDAPLKLLDRDFKIIAESYISAKGEWMTTNFVNFEGRIEFDAPDDERGYLLLERANPSGLPENDKQYHIPVIFPPK
ncbi:Gmad2 immunoglobulin-like domain-containing protein [Gramella sp. GC03-9]|uniref:Gmad2 immunoglobulin-like domain-containing protein n=1 Tax=Christiangramia oceanisediminis TaxID=2920386 RepID=A0A9X2I5P8_9FLAO|nr:Gmad2 immunoglobulin-like domain-containing protein [Gramella oceanisediminis]MCP9198369.1 Gmad2 immunoglobulin-like domain-containing protein [Gramella oceanisediminis]